MSWRERRERYTGDWKADLQCGYGEHVWIEDRCDILLLMFRCARGAYFFSLLGMFEGDRALKRILRAHCRMTSTHTIHANNARGTVFQSMSRAYGVFSDVD